MTTWAFTRSLSTTVLVATIAVGAILERYLARDWFGVAV
jgi:hypothetical protein